VGGNLCGGDRLYVAKNQSGAHRKRKEQVAFALLLRGEFIFPSGNFRTFSVSFSILPVGGDISGGYSLFGARNPSRGIAVEKAGRFCCFLRGEFVFPSGNFRTFSVSFSTLPREWQLLLWLVVLRLDVWAEGHIVSDFCCEVR
jgi:hypothetical protein